MKKIFSYLMLAVAGLCLLEIADAAPAKKKKAPVFPNVELAEDKVVDVKAAAESGDTAALRKLGHYYMQQTQDAKGRECFLKAAEAGDAESRAWYAWALYMQHGYTENAEKSALEHARISAEAGNPMGLYFCGLFARNDEEYARECMEKAAEMGFVPAMRALADMMRREANRPTEREKKKFLVWYDKAIKNGDIESCYLGVGKKGITFERYPLAKTNSIIRKGIERAKKRPLCWYDTCFDFNFPLNGFAHGGARYFLVILGYATLENAAYGDKNRNRICIKNRKELYSYLEKQAEQGDPAACYAIVSMLNVGHIFVDVTLDVSFSNTDENYWRQKAEELLKSAPPLYRKLNFSNKPRR